MIKFEQPDIHKQCQGLYYVTPLKIPKSLEKTLISNDWGKYTNHKFYLKKGINFLTHQIWYYTQYRDELTPKEVYDFYISLPFIK